MCLLDLFNYVLLSRVVKFDRAVVVAETTLVSDLEMCISKHLEMVLMDLTMRSEVMSQNLIEQSSEAVIA